MTKNPKNSGLTMETLIGKMEEMLDLIHNLSVRVSQIEEEEPKVVKTGGLRLDVYFDSYVESYYMVSDIVMAGEDLIFCHLVKPAKVNSPSLNIETNESSFPERIQEENLKDYLFRVEATGDFDKLLTGISYIRVVKHVLKGAFTYHDKDDVFEFTTSKREPPDNVITYPKQS